MNKIENQLPPIYPVILCGLEKGTKRINMLEEYGGKVFYKELWQQSNDCEIIYITNPLPGIYEELVTKKKFYNLVYGNSIISEDNIYMVAPFDKNEFEYKFFGFTIEGVKNIAKYLIEHQDKEEWKERLETIVTNFSQKMQEKANVNNSELQEEELEITKAKVLEILRSL